MKRLILCRHAKSSWKDLSLDDIDRPLNKRGKRDAPEMGGRMARLGIQPDAIISSPAKRARKTARQLAEALGFKKNNVIIVDRIYDAGVDELLDIIHGFDDADGLVIMVGHNPETTIVANLLGGLAIDNIPTCGVVALDFAVDSWRDVANAGGSMAFFDYPKRTTEGRGG